MPDREHQTGISGFLGGHVALQVLQAGYAVRGSVRERLKLRIGAFLEVFRENPHYHRLVVDYMYARDDANAKAALKLMLQSVGDLNELIQEGVKAGEMEPLDGRLVHVATAALCEFLFSAKPVFSAIFGPKVETQAFLESYSDFVADLVLGNGRAGGAAREHFGRADLRSAAEGRRARRVAFCGVGRASAGARARIISPPGDFRSHRSPWAASMPLR